MTLLEYACQLVLNLALGYAFGTAFAFVVMLRLERNDRKRSSPGKDAY